MINYESDPRPFAEALADFALAVNSGQRYGSRIAAAEALRVEQRTIDGWMAGRPCGHEAAFRRLMAMIARHGA